jgi:moderate conductance mechanosensitive channel
MTLPPVGSLYPLVGATEQGSGWLYNLLIKSGVDPETAKTVTTLVVRPLGVLLVILSAIVVARLGSKALRRILQRFADRAEARSGSSRIGTRMSTVSAVVANVWRFLVFVIAVAICLGIIGINLTPLLASATIIGATLGFGAQLIVRDYFSGFLLTLEDQYGIGDTITVGTVSGVVEDLTLRVTSVRAADGTVYTIANGEIRQLANASRGRAQAVVDLTLPGSAAADLPHARAVIEEAARRVIRSPRFAGHATEPAVLVTLVGSTESTLTLRLSMHTEPGQRDALRRALREQAIVDLSGAELWPAPPPDPEPPIARTPSSGPGSAES